MNLHIEENNKKPFVYVFGDLSDKTVIYHCIDLCHFLSFVRTKQLYLSRVMSWNDKFELPLDTILSISSIFSNDAEEKLRYLKRCLYGHCWSMKKNCPALWGENTERIQITTKVGNFRQIRGLDYAYISKVTYYNEDEEYREFFDMINADFPDLVPLDCSAFLKRQDYSYENEIRLVYAIKENMKINSEPAEGILVDLNPFDFIEGITIHPNATQSFVDKMIRYCRIAGFDIEPQKSLFNTR